MNNGLVSFLIIVSLLDIVNVGIGHILFYVMRSNMINHYR